MTDAELKATRRIYIRRNVFINPAFGQLFFEANIFVGVAQPNMEALWEAFVPETELHAAREALRSAYGYVKAHEYEGLTKGILEMIDKALGEE